MKNLYCRFCFDSSAAIVASPKGSIRGKFKTRNKIGSKDFFKHVSNINSTLKNRILTENPDFGVREKSETWKSYFQIVLYVYIWCILENIKKPSFLSKTGPRTKFVRENFFTQKLPITCRFQICTFWKTGQREKTTFRHQGNKNGFKILIIINAETFIIFLKL